MRNFYLGELIALKLANKKADTKWCYGQKYSSLKVNDDVSFDKSTDICRFLAKISPSTGLLGSTALQNVEVNNVKFPTKNKLYIKKVIINSEIISEWADFENNPVH